MRVDGGIQIEWKEQGAKVGMTMTAWMHNRFYLSPVYSFTIEAYDFECKHCCITAV